MYSKYTYYYLLCWNNLNHRHISNTSLVSAFFFTTTLRANYCRRKPREHRFFVILHSGSSLKDGAKLKNWESLFFFFFFGQFMNNVKCKKIPHPSFVGHGEQKQSVQFTVHFIVNQCLLTMENQSLFQRNHETVEQSKILISYANRLLDLNQD